MNEFFEPTCIYYALRLSARKLELKKKTLMMSTGMCGGI